VILIAHRTETYAHADTVITMPQRGAPPRPTLAAAG
jgi:ABC-type bacteriocin/lantibiotic exporter with double-glycine peptidase domain